MSETNCPLCGYPVADHSVMSCTVKLYGGTYYAQKQGHRLLDLLVEARHWARRMMRERDGARQMYDLVVTDLHHWKGEFAASNGYFWRMMRERDAIQAKAQEQAEMIQRDCTSPYEVSEMLGTIARMAEEFEKVKAERDELQLALTNTKFRSRETWIWKD